MTGMAEESTPGTLRVGMIGCGEVAYSLTGKSLSNARNARMVLAMDDSLERARSFGAAFGVPATDRLDQVLENPEVDAVVISTPHVDHEPLTVRAAAAGKHVMCEKPIACTLDQADRMIEACKSAGVFLGINMVARYESVTRSARDFVQSGAIGDVIGLNVHFTIRKPDSYWDGGFTGRARSPWRRSWASAGGGVMMINIIHELDRLCFIAGVRPVSVSADIATFCSEVEVEDSAAATYRFSNGAIGSITASSCAYGDRSFGVQIIGTHGQITFGAFAARLLRDTLKRNGRSYALRRIVPEALLTRLARPSLKVFTVRQIPGLKANRWNTLRAPVLGDARRLYVERFAEAVAEGREPEVGGAEGRRILEAVLAAYGSARTGTRWMLDPASYGSAAGRTAAASANVVDLLRETGAGEDDTRPRLSATG